MENVLTGYKKEELYATHYIPLDSYRRFRDDFFEAVENILL